MRFKLILLLLNLVGFGYSQSTIQVVKFSDALPLLNNKRMEFKASTKNLLANYNPSQKITTFVTNNTLKIIDFNGNEKTSIDLDAKKLASPVHLKWSRDGEYLLCSIVRNGDRRNRSLYRIGIDGSFQLLVEANDGEQILQPDFGPNDNEIVFLMTGSTGSIVKILNLTTSKEELVADGAGNAVWFHQQNKIIYKKFDRNSNAVSPQTNLYLYYNNKKSISKIFGGPFYGTYPAISPNDSLVLIHVGHFTIIDPSGHIVKELKGSRGTNPAWSPNGRYIAYLKGTATGDPGRITSNHIHVVSALTGDDYDLTPQPDLIVEAFKWLDDNTITYTTDSM